MLINLRNALMAGKKPPAPVGINYVECLNNTTCLCHTPNIAQQSAPFTISVWANISSSQPSLSEGRVICLTGTYGTATRGIDLGLTKSGSDFKIGAFIQYYDLGSKITYTPYLDAWHNIVITQDNSSVYTYIDGVGQRTARSTSYTMQNVKLGLGCIQWFGNMLSGGPIGKYANLAYFGRRLSASEITNLASDITHLPTDADHCYDMVIANGRIADIGTLGGWDFTTISDFQNGVYVPPQ